MTGRTDPNPQDLRSGTPSDIDACVALWVAACGARDGAFVPGVAERARPKFAHAEVWILAPSAEGNLAGFVLATTPGSGQSADPVDAAVLSLIAVTPGRQGAGLGAHLLEAATAALAELGHARVILHALTDNARAVRLYESLGWRPLGEPFEHALLQRPMQTYETMLALT